MKSKKIRGNKLYFKELNADKTETILLVHGHPFNHSMWKYQYDTLKEYRLILPDLLGYGRSDFNFDKIHIESQALDLALLLDELGINKVHLIGLSMGGQIIVEFQRLFPNRVQTMIICASTPFAETNESFTKRLDLAESILDSGMESHTKNTIHKYINIGLNDEKTKVYHHLFEMMSTTEPSGAAASHRGRAERRNNFNHLDKVIIPTLVIAGEKDHFFKVEDIKNVHNRLPNSELAVIKESGHLPNMEKPEEFNSIIENFYKKQIKPVSNKLNKT